MTVLRNQCEKQLIPYLEDLRQKKKNAWVMWLRLSRLKPDKQNNILERIAQVADHVAIYGEHTIFMLCDGDAVMVSEQIYSTHGARIIREISPLLSTQEEAPEDLCAFYTTPEQFRELSIHLGELRTNERLKPVEEVIPSLLNAALLRHALSERRSRKKLCVLVVEDQRFSCKLVVDIVSRQFEYLVAENGIEALYHYEAHAPDIVFLDIGLPTISGQSVLQKITTVDNDSFVVMLTASQEQEDVEHALKSGAMGYIVKPFSRQKIDRYIALYREHFTARGIRSA